MSDSDGDDVIPCGVCNAAIPDPVYMCCLCLTVECSKCRKYQRCSPCQQWYCEACLGNHEQACHPASRRITGKRTLEPLHQDEQPATKLQKAEWFDLTMLDSDQDDENPSIAKPNAKVCVRLRTKQPCDSYKRQQVMSDVATESARGTLNARPPEGLKGQCKQELKPTARIRLLTKQPCDAYKFTQGTDVARPAKSSRVVPHARPSKRRKTETG